jgi:hypothetical protein
MSTILGLSLPAFTQVHVAISLVGIAAGLLMFVGLSARRWPARSSAVFLLFTILTSVTGFFFPSTGFTPAQGVGIISLVILGVALLALYGFGRRGIWRPVYAIAVAIAQWFNIFVLVTQAFQKIPALSALPPAMALVAQGAGVLLMVWLGWRAVKSRA